MATVTVIIRLRRTEGRRSVNAEELAEVVAEAIDTAVGYTELSVLDVDGEEAAYEVTAVRATVPGEEAPTNNAWPETECSQCGVPIQSDRNGRPRLYCGELCRQRAHRARSRPA